MDLNFAGALESLGPNAAFRIAKAARAPGDYLWNSFLPDREEFSYYADSGNMVVRPTMPGLVGMDSPYPPMGNVTVSSFMEESAKLAGTVPLTEKTLRKLQDMMLRLGLGSTATNERLVEEALNFLQTVIIQPHMDVREWLKGQAIAYGEIDWTFNNKNLVIDYGIPEDNFLTMRTGTDAYGGSTSKFWDDVRALRRLLRKYSRVVFVAHPDTVDAAQYNPANNMATINEGDGSITFRRFVESSAGATAGVFSADATDTVTLVKYGYEGEILNPAMPSSTITLPFLDRGKLVAIGLGRRAGGYVVGQGAVAEDPNSNLPFGYGHVAPTVEGGGQPGLWADLFTPEQQPWQLVGRGAQNFLPVIEDPLAVAVATTAMPEE